MVPPGMTARSIAPSDSCGSLADWSSAGLPSGWLPGTYTALCSNSHFTNPELKAPSDCGDSLDFLICLAGNKTLAPKSEPSHPKVHNLQP